VLRRFYIAQALPRFDIEIKTMEGGGGVVAVWVIAKKKWAQGKGAIQFQTCQ